MTELRAAERMLRDAVLPLPAQTPLLLLRMLLAAAKVRAARIAELRELTGSLADLLIDCEEDRQMGLMVADILKESVPPSERP